MSKVLFMKSKNLETYCITSKKINFLENLNLKIIVGGAANKNNGFPENWLLDNNHINISLKNESFGSLTSIYWIWKNELKKYNMNTWIGISHYRRFWLKENHDKDISINNLNDNLFFEVSGDNLNFDAFVASPQNLTGYKLIKLLKKAKKNILLDPTILIDKKKHNINLHFDMFHKYNGLKKAASVLRNGERDEFLKYINTKTEYFPFSIFILKRDKFHELCEATFTWLENCEKIFDTTNFKGYGQIRFFDFLAERYFSFWIEKNTSHKVIPLTFFDPKIINNFQIIT
jgi:hypothetical protein